MNWLKARSEEQPSGCWHWTKYVGPNGYGYATVDCTPTPAPRISFKIKNGHYPDVCRHKCDNRLCVNPDHLEDGSPADNARDFSERSNAHRGEDHERAKLSDLEVVQIRELHDYGFKQVDIAKLYEVSQSAISLVVRRKRRKTR